MNKLNLVEAIERMIEKAEETKVICNFTYKNISMSMEVDPTCVEFNQEQISLKDFYSSINHVEFNLKDIVSFKYYSPEDAKNNMDSGILSEHLVLKFEDSQLIILVDSL